MGRGGRAGPGPITGVETVGTGTDRPLGVVGVGGYFFPVRGWLFEQVEGISNTVNTGALDKTVRTF